jgi:hypothetical protein
VAAQPARQVRSANARGDAEDKLAAQMHAHGFCNGTHLLGFDREQHHLLVDLSVDGAGTCDTVLPVQALARLFRNIDHTKIGGFETLLEQPADHCAGHVAAAYKEYAHGSDLKVIATAKSPVVEPPARTPGSAPDESSYFASASFLAFCRPAW